MQIFKYIYISFFSLWACFAASQQYAVIYGNITDENGSPVEFANILVPAICGTATNPEGGYELKIPASTKLKIIISHLEFGSDTIVIYAHSGERIQVNHQMRHTSKTITSVNIISEKYEAVKGMTLIPVQTLKVIPSASQSIESVLIGQLGVSKQGGELSSQYSVRGGNFDENLVYVNDIEVYRPFLIRSGQQEGLSFTNPDMVSSVMFSPGGFDARYGDKMSSVLDIKYRKPTKYASSFSAGLLGGSAYLEGSTANHRFTHISGIRYKTSKYMLKSLDTRGEYNPSFFDFQTYLTYDVSTNFELGFLGNISQNKYDFIPETLETAFGSWDEALNLKIYFDGQETDRFYSLTGAVTGTYRPDENKLFKFIASAYNTMEEETFDIMGQYFINELDKDLSSERFGDSLMNIGIGTFLNHARNYLDATMFNFSHKAVINGKDKKNKALYWGIDFQHEIINDHINEWQMIDSAGYSLPNSDTAVYLYNVLHAGNFLESNRGACYLQHYSEYDLDSNKLSVAVGLRGNYWDFSNEFVFGPRFIFTLTPNWQKKFLFRFASGYYYQPPFYKELRDLDGNMNYNIKAQKSIHFVLGGDYYFELWGRPFKYVTEIFYKKLDNLIPYIIDQVRVRYLANETACGYAMGIDIKINGEFVKGVESWGSLSIMRTKEDIVGDYYIAPNGVMVYPGYVPRPSDQLVNFGLFFQDYIPRHPSYKVHLSMMFGSGLPFGPPKSIHNRTAFRMPPYRRVDIGFSKEIISELAKLSAGNPLKYIKSIWICGEVLNLIDINNTISYLWVSDIYGRQLAVPNYLTSRRLNIRLTVKF